MRFFLPEKDVPRSLLGGVLILGAGNLAVKLIGLFFKIPLSRLLGDLGMGYFNTGYTVYSWLFLVGCTGFPVAVSMLVSESLATEGDGRTASRSPMAARSSGDGLRRVARMRRFAKAR